MNRRDILKLGALGAIGLAIAPGMTFGKAIADATLDKFQSIAELAKKNHWAALPINEMMGIIGMELIGLPYVGGTLEGDEIETCKVNLTGLDCVTFFENVLGMARIFRQGKYEFDDLLAAVTHTRYRGGKLDGYLSRLHYTADWIHDNVGKGTIKDLTKEIGGDEIKFKVSFMSENPKYYAPLKDNPEAIAAIAKIEKQINSRVYHQIPVSKVAAIEERIPSGSIIAIVTSKAGLDYSHTGMAYRDKSGVLHFLHASQKLKRVTLDERLSDYIKSNSKNVGISVLLAK